MSNFQVPAPPKSKLKSQKTPREFEKPALKSLEKRRAVVLDEAFLRRAYRANLWFGIVLSLTVGLIGQSIAATLSSLAGLLTGLLFLKTQELFVARLLRSKTGLQISDSWHILPTWLLVPGKYVVLIAAILLMRGVGLLNYVTFVGGCLAVQLILLIMATGRLMSRHTVDGNAGLMLRDVYVTPRQMTHKK